MSRPSSPRPGRGSGPRPPRRNLDPGDDAPDPFSGIMPHSDLIPGTLRMMGPKELATMRMVSTELMTPPPDATAEETANTHEELHKYTNLLLTAGRVVRPDNTQVDPTTPIADVLTNVSEGTMRFLPKPPP